MFELYHRIILRANMFDMDHHRLFSPYSPAASSSPTCSATPRRLMTTPRRSRNCSVTATPKSTTTTTTKRRVQMLSSGVRKFQYSPSRQQDNDDEDNCWWQGRKWLMKGNDEEEEVANGTPQSRRFSLPQNLANGTAAAAFFGGATNLVGRASTTPIQNRSRQFNYSCFADFGGSSGSLSQEDAINNMDLISRVSEEFPSNEARLKRRRCVQELLSTERDYVRLLQNLVQGFVVQCRRLRELFPEERMHRIFGNLEMIHILHTRLLRELHAAVDEKEPEQSAVASVFLRNSHRFDIYTDYCNNRTVSCMELTALEQQPKFHHFFEACRLLRGMPALSLDSILLTPVQRICRYPLQLLELLKATPDTHRDKTALDLAQRTMRQVAAQVNDGKRRVEAIQSIWLWQKSVHGFRGPDLIDINQQLLLNSEINCRLLCRSEMKWSKCLVYLFDQAIVLCRRDMLRRSQLAYKAHMSLQGASVQDLHDDTSLKNAFKLISPNRDMEIIFSCPDPATKGVWLKALRERPRPQPATPTERRLATCM